MFTLCGGLGITFDSTFPEMKNVTQVVIKEFSAMFKRYFDSDNVFEVVKPSKSLNKA